MQNTGENSQQSRQKKLLEEGKFYEYGQIAQIRAKRDLSRGNFESAYNHAYTGAYELLGCEQFESGVALAEMMVDIVKSYKPDVQTISKIFTMLPAEYKHKFIVNILRILPDNALLETYAADLEREGDYGKALVYWTAADSLESILRDLNYLLSVCYPEELDLLILRTALHASKVLLSFPAISSPLTNFGTFLIQALSITDNALASILKERYSKSLGRDPMLEEYLAQIEKVYFGVERSNARSGLLSLLTG